MKNQILKFILASALGLLCSSSGFGQNYSIIDDDGAARSDNFTFFRPARIEKCKNLDCEKGTGTFIEVPENTNFRLVDQLQDGAVVVKLWKYKKEEQHQKLNLDPAGNYIYYKVSAKDFTNKVSKRYNTGLIKGLSFTSGVILLPVKIRPSQGMAADSSSTFDFSKDVSLGATFGAKWRIAPYRKRYLNALFNIGIGNISLNEHNTNNTVDTSSDVPALTLAVGSVFEFNGVQLGLFIGWDKISGKNNKNWIYQGKTWYSIGLGVPIFTTSGNGSNSKKELSQGKG